VHDARPVHDYLASGHLTAEMVMATDSDRLLILLLTPSMPETFDHPVKLHNHSAARRYKLQAHQHGEKPLITTH